MSFSSNDQAKPPIFEIHKIIYDCKWDLSTDVSREFRRQELMRRFGDAKKNIVAGASAAACALTSSPYVSDFAPTSVFINAQLDSVTRSEFHPDSDVPKTMFGIPVRLETEGKTDDRDGLPVFTFIVVLSATWNSWVANGKQLYDYVDMLLSLGDIYIRPQEPPAMKDKRLARAIDWWDSDKQPLSEWEPGASTDLISGWSYITEKSLAAIAVFFSPNRKIFDEFEDVLKEKQPSTYERYAI